MNFKMLLLLIVSLLLASCSKGTGSSSWSKLLSGDYFSMRQQSVTTVVGIIQLKTPALLRSATIENGHALIDEDAKKELLQEQEDVIKKLQALSSDIKIISRYKLVLNGIAYEAPSNQIPQIEKIEGVLKVAGNTIFERPKILNVEEKVSTINVDLNAYNTTHFIGANKMYEKGIKGQGIRIGIIDTGIDYTHKMFGGPGTKDAYNSVDPNRRSEFFPNEKVVGGVDFAGTNFNSASPLIENQIPVRDENPLDEAEHGTHVAGTVAGLGDGINTYSGVAPLAQLYALKVFGKEGSTSDIVVISALEYAADVSEKLNPQERLDVVNLSLGGGYGKPKILYSEAVHNLTRGGTIVVASAGNSGDESYIVGAPSTAEEAISVAASIDDLPQNIISNTVQFLFGNDSKKVELIEGSTTLPAHSSHVEGEVIFIGNGKDPINDSIKERVKGKIALIDRGEISFEDKFEVASKLGASGVVIANNVAGDPFPMGTKKSYTFPAIMVSKDFGDQAKKYMESSPLFINFTHDDLVRHEEKIDQITDFSSRGPRSLDSLLKPEIAAPGSNIISAKCGSGFEGVQFSGTSMAGPHMAGVMGLLRQQFPSLTVEELKTIAMNTSKIMMKDGHYVDVALQGAGRVQVDQAINAKVLAMPAGLSLGEIGVASAKTIFKIVTLKNISDVDVTYSVKFFKGKNVDVVIPATVQVKAHSMAKMKVSFTLRRKSDEANNIETDGFIILTSNENESIHLPFLGVINKVSDIRATEFLTKSDSKIDRAGSEVSLTLKNNSKSDGDALIFNLLRHKDDKKADADPNNLSSSNVCDLEAVGMRVIDKLVEGKNIKMLQVGVKLYDSQTMWQQCDLSMQIDSNFDGKADYELVGIRGEYLPGLPIKKEASVLLGVEDAKKIRKTYESDPIKNQENYLSAIIDANEMIFYPHSSLAVMEVDLSKVPTDKRGYVGIKLAVTNLESETTSDDFLLNQENKWMPLNLKEEAMAFGDMPEVVTVKANGSESITLKRNFGKQRLMILYPHNLQNVPAGKIKDLEILTEHFIK